MALFADKIVASLADRHPDACRHALDDVSSSLSRVEGEIGVIPTTSIELGRDYLVADAQTHQGLSRELPEHGVLFYRDHGGRVGDSSCGN